MPRPAKDKPRNQTGRKIFWLAATGVIILCLICFALQYFGILDQLWNRYYPIAVYTNSDNDPTLRPILDKAAYDLKLLELAHIATSTIGTSSPSAFLASSTSLWPVHTTYPQGGAILPFSRIVAYYGNFYSAEMGVLGQYPPAEVLEMLASTSAAWAEADPSTPVISAIDYIAVVAEGSAGGDGKYRSRMPASQIDQALSMANEVHGLLFLDIQVGLSNLRAELPLLTPYLKMPQVELAIDPEFSMKDGARPGSEIGTFDASDINYAAEYLASIVDANNLPPKILVVHRFTDDMVTNYQKIQPLPEVEIVMDMDGWGPQPNKIATYDEVIHPEPVQFTGIKLFYQNDLRPPSTGMLTPAQVLKLDPAPVFIQYQ